MQACLVIGAGASLAHAAHFRPRRETHTKHPPLDTTFFAKVAALDLTLSPDLQLYIQTLTGADLDLQTLSNYRMEEFFKDAYFDFRDRPKSDRVRTAYTDLVVLYHSVLRETTNWLCDDGHLGGPIGRMIAAAASVADDVTIVTFNHDLLIENEIFKRALLRKRWCIDQSYGSFGQGLGRLNTGGRPEFPAHHAECDHSRPIRLFKLHGSLNWIVRIHGSQPTVSDLTGEGRLRDAFLNPSRVIEEPLFQRAGQGPGRRSWHTWPVVVPPVYAKQALISRLQAAWDDARAAIEAADLLVFYGYSLPQLDIEAEKLFQRGINANAGLGWVDVINPAPAAAERYSGIAPQRRLRRYPSLDTFLDANPFENGA